MSTNTFSSFEDQFSETVVPEGKTLRAFKLLNAGKLTLMSNMSLVELNHYSDVANNRMAEDEQSQRPLDLAHANKLAKYFLKALLNAAMSRLIKQGKAVNEAFFRIQEQIGKQPYYTIAPLIANLRTNSLDDVRQLIDKNNEVIGHQITLKVGDTLWIVDGQHRRKAIEIVIDFLKYINSNFKYPGKGSIFSEHKNRLSPDELEVWSECKDMCTYCKVAIEIHLGLDIEEERQLFYDLNQLGKRIDASLANKYDSSNPINNYISEVLINDIFSENNFLVLDSSNESDWQDEMPSITRKSLAGINSILFLNKPNINGATPADITEFKKEISNRYWSNVFSIPGFMEKQPKLKTVASQPVVLKSIAKLYYDTFFGKSETLNNEENQAKLIEGLATFDFSHKNPAWRYYLMGTEERIASSLSGLTHYLPVDGEGYNRDMGGYDIATETFRFGAKHNDIVPLIADIIRWHCELPSRQK
jgi:hypothetical protein